MIPTRWVRLLALSVILAYSVIAGVQEISNPHNWSPIFNYLFIPYVVMFFVYGKFLDHLKP